MAWITVNSGAGEDLSKINAITVASSLVDDNYESINQCQGYDNFQWVLKITSAFVHFGVKIFVSGA